MSKQLPLSRNEFALMVVLATQKYAEVLPPQEFKAMLMGGIMANIIGQMPERYWQEFIKAEPCGQPNCDCHQMAAEAAPVLQGIRDDYRKHGPRNN